MLRRGIAVLLGPTCSSLKPFKITATRPRRVIELNNDFRYVTTAAPSGSLFASITLGLVIIENEYYSTRLLIYVYDTTDFELSLLIQNIIYSTIYKT